MTAQAVEQALQAYASDTDAAFAQRFFKTGPGQYGEGDQFIGVRVPQTRLVCREFKHLPLPEIEKLLDSPIHEHRLAAVIIMADLCRARSTSEKERKALYDLYLRRSDRLNNWDIIDVSCRDVVGGYLLDKPRGVLYELARSENMWERRIAMVSTWQFIREHQLDDTFRIAEVLLSDKHDLIHKAVGWMLREAGKRDRAALLGFLEEFAPRMPRTALRYAIEHLPAGDRLGFLSRKL